MTKSRAKDGTGNVQPEACVSCLRRGKVVFIRSYAAAVTVLLLPRPKASHRTHNQTTIRYHVDRNEYIEAAEAEEGATDGEEWGGKIIHAIDRLQQLRRQRRTKIGSHNRCRAQQYTVHGEPYAESLGLRRVRTCSPFSHRLNLSKWSLRFYVKSSRLPSNKEASTELFGN